MSQTSSFVQEIDDVCQRSGFDAFTIIGLLESYKISLVMEMYIEGQPDEQKGSNDD